MQITYIFFIKALGICMPAIHHDFLSWKIMHSEPSMMYQHERSLKYQKSLLFLCILRMNMRARKVSLLGRNFVYLAMYVMWEWGQIIYTLYVYL